MITCCEIAITLAITNLLSLAVFAGYTVHLRLRQLVLEKKNGAEQHQIDELKKELAELKRGVKGNLLFTLFIYTGGLLVATLKLRFPPAPLITRFTNYELSNLPKKKILP